MGPRFASTVIDTEVIAFPLEPCHLSWRSPVIAEIIIRDISLLTTIAQWTSPLNDCYRPEDDVDSTPKPSKILSTLDVVEVLLAVNPQLCITFHCTRASL
jgi:hypothetical protein